MPQQNRTFEAPVTKTASLKYLLYLPPDYEKQDKWPLMIFLHGYGERGDDLELVKKHGPPKLIDAGQDFPFIIVSPQCPDTTVWPEQADELKGLIDSLIAEHKVDTSRVYLTGLSMGGYGTWYLASRYPEKFAAIAPICGGGGWWMAGALKNIPAWVFHGDADPVVPLIESEVMVSRIKQAGGEVNFTVYPGVDHDSWTETYNNPELYEWFLSHPKTITPLKKQTFQTHVTQKIGLSYWLYLPPDYDAQVEWPLIMFLHGRGERGDDIEMVKKHGLPKNIAEGKDYPFVVVAPQCPLNSHWSEQTEALDALLDHLIANCKIDMNRVYLTGLSMGGAGTWSMATRYPERFAAIVPICGHGQLWLAQERLSTMPIWVFHGDADSIVPVERSQEMVDALRENSSVKFTVYPGVDHDSWTQTYNNPELYDWLLSHRRQTK